MHPILFAIGPFFIGTYGAMIALGLLFAIAVAWWRAKQVELPPERIFDLAFVCILSGIVGGRVAYVFVNFSDFVDDPWSILLSRTGFVFLGGFVFAVAAGMVAIRRWRVNAWLIADVAITSVPLGHFFGRLGCFFAGCCYGGVCDPNGPFGFLGMRFPASSHMGQAEYPGMAFSDHVYAGLLPPTATESLPVWPTQLLEAGGNLLIFAALMAVWRWRKFDGMMVLLYVASYSILRFGIEFLRGDAERGFWGPFSTSQWIGLAGVIFVIAAWAPLARRGLRPAMPPTPDSPQKPRAERRRAGKGKKS